MTRNFQDFLIVPAIDTGVCLIGYLMSKAKVAQTGYGKGMEDSVSNFLVKMWIGLWLCSILLFLLFEVGFFK